MSWSQVSERRWERPANGMEGFFEVMENTSSTMCDGRRQFTIFSRLKVDLQIPDAEDALRYAWKQLRYEQPQIAVTTEGFNKIYEVPDEASLQSWLDETFIVSDDAEGETIGNDACPISQATLYYVPKASQLVIRVSHSLIDGIGMVRVWDSYLKALTNPKPDLVFGEESSHLVPALEKAFGHPDVLPEETVAKGAQVTLDAVGSMPGIGPRNRIGTVPAGPARRRDFELSEQATEAIVRACKKNGYSVSAAVHAAFALTVVKHADPAQTTDKSKYVTVNSYNLRSYLPAPYNETAAALYYSIRPLVLDKPDNFKDLVRAIDADYNAAFKNNAENLVLCGPVTNTLREIVKTPEFWAAPPARDALVSSLGVLERHLQQSYSSSDGSRRVIVEGFKLGTEIILGHSMFFFYTFRNRLQMVFSYNEAYEDEAHIQTYLEDVQKILVEELVA
ncbi:hypothetical protein N7468_005542 [Penicillium chermesinum]|uniref:Uncharacterized protein n=1 Tax=Penicillium chermesinum TaxID=63820 RepID=A0A9W9NZP3_9EURO|nr:uncharacterized protein N7468_005542 [Penicillium chermesinum]KAJ5232586.1 hypothetical protein N7468_005542 [Penicillium chermesinum]KAJ6172241.1 hypothetical protein N7470_001308 [Penicillium chermesinum]